jgi:hypothetical protein
VALLTTYLLCELLNHGAFVINFVLVVLLQAVEFWYVKVRHPRPPAAPRGRRRAAAASVRKPSRAHARAHAAPGAERERAKAGGAALLELHQRNG